MNSNDPQNENVAYGSDIINRWKKRSRLEQKLIISLLIVTLVLIGVLLFIIIKHAVAPKVCRTTTCISAAAQIAAHIDSSVDPCEDFFQFACGNFIKNSHGDMQASSISQLNEKVQRQLAEILNEPIQTDENPWIRSQKSLFQACMNESAVEEESIGVFEATLDELHGWPVVVGSQWNERLFDWKYMIYQLREKGYPHSMLLDVRVIPDPDPGNGNRHIVGIFPPFVNLVSNEHKELYKKYMIDVAVIFGAERYRAVSDMERVFDFMENLRKIYKESHKQVYDATPTDLNQSAALAKRRFIVKDYQELNSEIDWLDYINTVLYPVGKITGNDYAMFPEMKYTDAFFRLVYRTNKRTLANYIIWSVLEKIKPYMSKELKERETTYSCLTGETSINQNRFQFCENEISTSYNFLRPLDVMYARKFLPRDHREKVKELVTNVKSEFISVLKKVAWMDKETKERALEKIKHLVEVIGAPGDYFNDVIFRQVLGDNYTEIQNRSFFRMFLAHNKLQTDSRYFKMHLNVNDTKMDLFYPFITTVGAMYLLQGNVILLPAALLQGIFYNPKRPMYLNYGALGSAVGHELAHGFDKAGSSYDKDGHEAVMWSNETRKAYEEKTKCIIQELNNFSEKNTETQVDAILSLDENVADYTGLKVSYAAYKNWIYRHGTEPQLPEIKYTPNQLFWISAVSYECSNIKSLSERDLSHAPNSFRATAPLRNNPDFAKDFSCPVGSWMNPPQKCQVF